MDLTDKEFSLFQQFIINKCGIEITQEKAYLIESRLTKILVDLGLTSFSELYVQIASLADETIISKVIDAITTNETLWFRDKTPWLILENMLLPKYIEMLRSRERTRIRIWSAATSTGQEAYSTAMCIHRYLETHGITDVKLHQFEILATDISSLVLNMAKQGKYDSISIMRGLDKQYLDTYFVQKERAWEVSDTIKQAVTFKQFNLQDSFDSLGNFDVIFCRYVLIYFSEELKRNVLSKLYNRLLSDGIMFLGAYEICSMYSQDFVSNSFENGTFYTKAQEEIT